MHKNAGRAQKEKARSGRAAITICSCRRRQSRSRRLGRGRGPRRLACGGEACCVFLVHFFIGRVFEFSILSASSGRRKQSEERKNERERKWRKSTKSSPRSFPSIPFSSFSLLLLPLSFLRLSRSPNQALSDAHSLISTPLFASDQLIMPAAAMGATEKRAESATRGTKERESNSIAKRQAAPCRQCPLFLNCC